MKTSKLISALQKHNSSAFDADVVCLGDIYPKCVKRVYHEPPYTYLIFEGEEGPLLEFFTDELSEDEALLIQRLRKATPAQRKAAGLAMLRALGEAAQS